LKLFSEIDINGDQSMEWSEFMAYMIDAVSASAIPQVNKEKEAGADGEKEQTVMEVIMQQRAN
jgi:hypothetical protein